MYVHIDNAFEDRGVFDPARDFRAHPRSTASRRGSESSRATRSLSWTSASRADQHSSPASTAASPTESRLRHPISS